MTFRYDNSTHVMSPVYASQQPAAVAAAGDLDSELGCPGDWMPDCPQAQLALDPADLVWKLTFPELPAGTYSFKAALNRSWAENYGAGGVPGRELRRRRSPGRWKPQPGARRRPGHTGR